MVRPGRHMSIRNGLLALLSDGPRYGFQLKKEFEEYTAGFWELNVGQVYTTISRLVRDGLVIEDTDAEGTPEHGAEAQRLFRLTDAGATELEAWFTNPRESDRFERDELTIKIAMAIATGHPHISEMIHLQRIEATGVLQNLTRRKATTDPDDLASAVVIDAAISRVDAELRWLDLAEARLNQRGRTT